VSGETAALNRSNALFRGDRGSCSNLAACCIAECTYTPGRHSVPSWFRYTYDSRLSVFFCFEPFFAFAFSATASLLQRWNRSGQMPSIVKLTR
jgi:hypothetical protein